MNVSGALTTEPNDEAGPRLCACTRCRRIGLRHRGGSSSRSYTIASVATPASLDTTGSIGPQQRDLLTRALQGASITSRLSALSNEARAASYEGVDVAAPDGPEPLDNWEPTPGDHQSTDDASYRLGSDATSGVSALATVRLPRPGPQAGGIALLLDIGLSLAATMRLTDAALLLRDGLLLTSMLMPDALGGVLPTEADISQVELHVSAATTDGHSHRRHHRLDEHLDLSSLGDPTRELGETMGFAARVASGLSETEATELVAHAFEQMALAHGSLDPRPGLATLRRELLLDPSPAEGRHN